MKRSQGEWIMKAVTLGDLYQSDGRSRTVWSVDSIIDVPKSGTMVRLAKIDGYGSVTVHLSQLGVGSGFTKIDEVLIQTR